LSTALLVVLFASSSSAGAVSLRAVPDTVGQGRALSVRASFSNSPDTVTGSFLGREVHFFAVDSLTYGAIIGIPVKTTPGDKVLKVSARKLAPQGPHGPEPENLFAIESEMKVVVREVEYKKEPINLPMPMMDKLTSANLTRETDMMVPRFRTFSPTQMWDGSFIFPARGRISSPFGARRVYNDGKMSWHHKGVDIAGKPGDSVFACAGGRIIFTEDLTVHGKTIMIDHGHGVVSICCHLKEIRVDVGEIVDKGALIGILGLTGVGTGPHVHWGVSVGDVRVDPIEWVERKIE
jgi:murein DD-endopeptidase MepM/ murein hydrolase activator NlpD